MIDGGGAFRDWTEALITSPILEDFIQLDEESVDLTFFNTPQSPSPSSIPPPLLRYHFPLSPFPPFE